GKKPEAKAPEVKATDKKPEAKAPEVKATDKKPEAKAPEVKTEAKATESKSEEKTDSKLKLQGLFAFKLSMTSFYEDNGDCVPVTALQYEPWKVSQIKTKEKEGYTAIQLACKPQKNKRCSKALIKHLTPAGFKEGARYVKEIRQDLPEGIKVGQELSIETVKKGDRLKLTSQTKGLGFTGVMKRWNFAGGRASHGSKSHRRIGSIGQHTEPARVMPGRKMPGHCGFKKQSQYVKVVDVLPQEGMIFIKGAVPGSRNTLVTLQKMENA
ncbi:MAG: 50S ribosomal protein L3, partial [Bdellovibrionales bacterium]